MPFGFDENVQQHLTAATTTYIYLRVSKVEGDATPPTHTYQSRLKGQSFFSPTLVEPYKATFCPEPFGGTTIVPARVTEIGLLDYCHHLFCFCFLGLTTFELEAHRFRLSYERGKRVAVLNTSQTGVCSVCVWSTRCGTCSTGHQLKETKPKQQSRPVGASVGVLVGLTLTNSL